MTPERLRDCLAALDWSANGLARYLGMSSRTTVARWLAGETSIPHAVAAWLERLASAHEAAPYPEGWRIPERRDP